MRSPERRRGAIFNRYLWAAILAPALPLLWASIAFGWDHNRQGVHWASWVLVGLCISAFGLVSWCVSRLRLTPLLAALVVTGAAVLTFYDLFYGGSAIANDWL